jgi:hypothetical protein
MGRRNCLVDMNKVYINTKTTSREQPTICLRHIGGGPNNSRRQPRQRFIGVEGKSIAKCWPYKEDQLRVMRDQIEDLTTQLSNLQGHRS